MAETFGASTRTARKAHLCVYCGARVKVGEKYKRWAWSDGGTPYSAAGHVTCIEMAGSVYDRHDEEVWDWDEFREECREVFPERTFPWSEGSA